MVRAVLGTCIALAAALAACATTGDRGRGVGSRERSLEIGRRPAALAAADLDGDGRTDLVVANPWDGGSISVLASRSTTRHLPAPHVPLGVALADVNEDGRLDIVAANRKGFLVSVYLASTVGMASRSRSTTGPSRTAARATGGASEWPSPTSTTMATSTSRWAPAPGPGSRACSSSAATAAEGSR